MLGHIGLLSLGVLLIVGGFWGSVTLRKPFDALVAWGAPIGLLAVLAGIVWLIIPNFFVGIMIDTPVDTSSAAGVSSDKHRGADYLLAKQKARAWFDQLAIDPVALREHGMKDKKKLAELLDAYMAFYRHTTDAAERATILQRVEQLVRPTQQATYHNMVTNSDAEFQQNSMSYLRVLWLLDQFGLDTTTYRQQLSDIKPRLDAHLPNRGPWQQMIFVKYYDAWGLDKPSVLLSASMQQGEVARRRPMEQYDILTSYFLTHEVFVAYNYGFQHTQNVFTTEDLTYLHQVIPALMRQALANNYLDLWAEFVSCMTYLGWHDAPLYRQSIEYLLDMQNPDGTWGNYEARRSVYGAYVDQQYYLHTTLVAMRALLEIYEGSWQPAA